MTTAICERALLDSVSVRAIDEEARSATFVAATEGGVETWTGREFLRMAGVRLKRFRSNPVVLDTHNRFESGAVIGKAKVQTEGKELVAEITFAETERAETIWQLVKTGFIRALSVGFIPDPAKTKKLGPDDIDGDIVGPATIIRQWELIEISVVPVPADRDALRRSFLEGDTSALVPVVQSLVSTLEWLITPRSDHKENNEMEDEKGKAPKPEARGATQNAEGTTTPVVPDAAPIQSELAQRERAAINAHIRDIAPDALTLLAERCIIQEMTLEETREVLLVEQTKRMKPAGTSGETPVEKRGSEMKAAETKLEDVSDEQLTRAFTG